jgi:uncharacterized BrkB/YihY/UPF0761 family membrane protein
MVILMYLIKRIYHLLVESKIITLSGSFAFFLFLNGGSYLFLFIALSNYLPFDYRSLIIMNIENNLTKDVLLYFINHNASITYSIFLIITSIYSSSSLYYHFIHISEVLTDKDRNNKRLKSITVMVIFLTLVSFILSLNSIFLTYNYDIYKTVISLSLVLIIFILIYTLNVVGINTLNIKKLYKGMIFSYIYFVLLTIVFLIYLNLFSNMKIVYGIFSFIIVFMLYVYLISIGLLIGIYINGKNIEVYKLFKK